MYLGLGTRIGAEPWIRNLSNLAVGFERNGSFFLILNSLYWEQENRAFVLGNVQLTSESGRVSTRANQLLIPDEIIPTAW